MRERERSSEQEVKHPKKSFVIRVVYQTLYKKLLPPSMLLLVGGGLMYFVASIFPFHISHFFLLHLLYTPYSLVVFSGYSHCHRRYFTKVLLIHFLLCSYFTSLNIVIYSLFSLVLNLIYIFLINVLALTFKFTFTPLECLHLRLNTT
jgi:hypothetical protein